MPLYTQQRGLIIVNQFVPVSWDALYEALWLVEFGLIAFVGAYYLFMRSPLATVVPRLDLPLDPDRLKTYLSLSFLGGGTIMVLSAIGLSLFETSALGAVVRLAASQFNIALILLGYQIYQEERPSIKKRLVFYTGLAFAFLIGLTTGMLENAFIPLVSLFLVRWHASQRLPWRWLLVGVVLFIVLNPAKFIFRSLVWSDSSSYSLGTRLSLWTDLASDSTTSLLRPTSASDRGDQVLSALSRFDLIHKFAYVHTMTPQLIPYYNGDTYAYFLVAWIPRLFWQDKPTATSNANERMDVDYQLKYEGQATSIGIGLLPEAYANFGPAGVVFVMALQGLILAFLSTLLNGPNSQGGRAIYLSICIYFLNGIGSSASVMFGAIFQQAVFSAVILRFFASGWGALPTEESTVQHVLPNASVVPPRFP